jgi:tRNA dimethylallyltransferase
MNPLVAIVGPTAAGKSNLALELCRTLNGEIISADSRQVYRYMDIGTAKPTKEEQAAVPHHLIDVVDPDEDFSLAMYQRRALEAVQSIQRWGKTAFLVGGSGLYVWALLEGWRIPSVPPDYDLRRELEAKVRDGGGEALYEKLKEIDPAAAERIDPRNVRRVIRALEVCRQGTQFSELQVKKPFVDSVIIGLTTGRDDLYERIDTRVNSMIEQGLVQEVESLVARGYELDLPSMSGLGYREIGLYLQGKTDLATAIQQMKFDTHSFARHQYNWFRLKDKRINWFEAGESTPEAVYRFVQLFVLN